MLNTKIWEQFLTDRQVKEINFSINYVANYGHGTSGHLGYTTIAALAMLIEKMILEGNSAPKSCIISDETLKEFFAVSGLSIGNCCGEDNA